MLRDSDDDCFNGTFIQLRKLEDYGVKDGSVLIMVDGDVVQKSSPKKLVKKRSRKVSRTERYPPGVNP